MTPEGCDKDSLRFGEAERKGKRKERKGRKEGKVIKGWKEGGGEKVGRKDRRWGGEKR